MATMKAVVQSKYGSSDVLNIEQVEIPGVGPDDVRIKVHATAICRGDALLMLGKPYLIRLMGYGLFKPKFSIPGQDVAGVVEEVGENVKDLKVGDAVFGQLPMGGGAFAEYLSHKAEHFVPLPKNVSFEQAAALPDSAMTALQGLVEAGGLKAGQQVLINGASGGVGTFAVQIAKAYGAEVTAVCSTRHVEKLKEIGADVVIDYKKQDFAEQGRQYDLIFDLVGNRKISTCKKLLKAQGAFVASGGTSGGSFFGPMIFLIKVMLSGMFSSKAMKPLMMEAKKQDLLVIKQLVEEGKIIPIIERAYPLEQAIEALGHVAAGHAQGKTVMVVGG